jgi:predicted ATPase
VGERQEVAYGKRANEIAVELAMHFEQGRDYRRAVRYLQQAGENTTRRSAYVETIHHLTRGVELLQILPDTPERTQQELLLQIALGPPLMATKGFAASEVERAYARARELRAATSLARLWQQQGKHHAARNRLSEIYNWFTEGFDTKDLREAKALLEELA